MWYEHIMCYKVHGNRMSLEDTLSQKVVRGMLCEYCMYSVNGDACTQLLNLAYLLLLPLALMVLNWKYSMDTASRSLWSSES
jgi:hypothetical protein